MVESYRKRSEYKSIKKNIVNVIADDEIATDTKLISTGDSTVVGFNMIGESGCGKTSQIKIALDYYPKVIRHTNPDGSKTIQIPYLYIICPPHSNFKELYKTIADNWISILATQIIRSGAIYAVLQAEKWGRCFPK